MSSKLSDNLLQSDTSSFWKNWRHINGDHRSTSSMIDGLVDYGDIANRFSTFFGNVYKDSHANDVLKQRFKDDYPMYVSSRSNELVTPFLFSWSDMLDAVFNLKVGKATSTFVKAEHIFYGCPELLCYLHLLFNGLLSHSYLPHDFLCGTISPVVKDPNGDCTSSSNYRPITLGPIFSQMFEYALLNKFGFYLETEDTQFGFKKSHSTSHAIFILKECINYYTMHGSNVLVTFLDCSKAFDTVSHYGIFLKLMERGVPLCFLNIMIYWYLNMQARCIWRNVCSDFFRVLTGTKQGGVLSPRIFALYLDGLVERLRKTGVGCYILGLFLACLLYADDICLLAPSRGAMQQMLLICSEFCKEFNLSFNVKKSKSMLFGCVKPDVIDPLILNGEPMDYVSEWNYLGTTIISGTSVSFSSRSDLAKFYRASNSLIGSIQRPNELVLMNLLYANCVPSLSYAAEVKSIPSREMHNCNVALNDSIRRIFSYNRWESTRSLRQQFGFPNVTEIFQSRLRRFFEKCRDSHNSVVCFMAS